VDVQSCTLLLVGEGLESFKHDDAAPSTEKQGRIQEVRIKSSSLALEAQPMSDPDDSTRGGSAGHLLHTFPSLAQVASW